MLEWILTKYAVPISTVFANIMVGLVPIIIGWMRYFSTNIKVLGQSRGFDTFYGEHYSLKLENKTLRPFVIDKINVFVNKEQFFIIDLESLELEKKTLEPFKQLIIKEQWTTIQNCQEKISFDGIKFEVFCAGEIISIKYISLWQQLKYKFAIKYSTKKIAGYLNNNLMIYKRHFKDQIISGQVKYALDLFNPDNIFERTILITESGFMSDSVMGYSRLQPECMSSLDLLNNHIKDQLLKGSNYKFRIQVVG